MRIVDKLLLIAQYQVTLAIRYRNGAPFRLVASAVEIASAYFLARAIGPTFRPDGLSYFAFLLTGTSLYIFLLSIVSSCVSFVDDAQRSGTLEVLMTTPTPPLQVLLLNTAPVLVWRIVGLAAYLVVGVALFAMEPLHVNIGASIVVFGLLIVVATSMGILAAAIQILFLRGNSLVWALGVLGGMFMGSVFPVSVLPRQLQWVSSLLPLRAALDAFRAAVLQNMSIWQLKSPILQLGVCGGVCLALGVFCFQRALRRARELGTLGFY